MEEMKQAENAVQETPAEAQPSETIQQNDNGAAGAEPALAPESTEGKEEGGNGTGSRGLLGGEPSQPSGEEEKAVEEPGKEDGPPEDYGDFNFMEGVTPNDAALADFKTLAREFGLSKAKAQKLVDLQNRIAREGFDAAVKRYDEEVQAITDKWEADVRADPELGGAALDDNMRVAKSVFRTLGVPEAFDVIMKNNMGSNPAILRLLYRAGKALGEASFVHGRNEGAAPVSAAKAIYPDMN